MRGSIRKPSKKKEKSFKIVVTRGKKIFKESHRIKNKSRLGKASLVPSKRLTKDQKEWCKRENMARPSRNGNGILEGEKS